MMVLDLFCGTKSLKQPCEDLGFEYFGIDIDPSFNPDMVADIGSLDFWDIPFQPDVVWASPPCTAFSVASLGYHWMGGYRAYIPKTTFAENSIKLVNKTFEIICCMMPKYYFIENPRGILRKLDLLPKHRLKTVTYCQYGDTRMKPTDIWTNCQTWNPKPMCKNGDPCHERAPRGSKTGTQGLSDAKNRAVVPYELLKEILEACIE